MFLQLKYKFFNIFLEFLKVDDTTEKRLFDAIMNEINNIGLDISNLRGKHYDDQIWKENIKVCKT